MKKMYFSKRRYFPVSMPTAISKAMRITAFFLFVCALNVHAKSYSQDRLSLNLKEVKLSQVFAVIQQKTDYQFLYNTEDVQNAPLVSITVKKATVPEILADCFENYPLGYRIENKTVVVVKKIPSKSFIHQSGSEEGKPGNSVYARSVFASQLSTPLLIQKMEFVVKGKVTDESGNPLVGVSVTLKGSTTKGTTTDGEGNYSISLNDGNGSLVFSFVGFVPLEVQVKGRNTIDIALSATVSSLEQVVVVGYGTQRKRDLTGAVTSVKTDDVTQSLNISPSSLLQDKVAGLEVSSTSGAPGAVPTVQIRGTSSIRSSNNPLYVVDGVPLDGISVSPTMDNSFGTTPHADPLLFINPNDIEQMDVLKDASATAIYGSRGANGVIMITTKKGKSGKTNINFGVRESMNAGYMRRFKILDVNQFRTAINKFLAPDVVQSYDGGQDVDALKAITQNKISQDYSMSISAGNDRGSYRASFLVTKDNGFLKKSSLYKYLGSFGGEYNFFDNRVKVGFNVSTAHFGLSGVSIGQTSGNNGNLLIAALEWNPTQPLMVNGQYNWPTTGGAGQPLAFADAFSDLSNVSEILSNFNVSYKIFDKLTYKFLYGINHGTGERKINTDGWLRNFLTISGIGDARIGNQTLTSQVIDHTLNYNSEIGDNINLDAVVGYEYFKTDISGASVTAKNFNTNMGFDSRIPILYTDLFQNALTQTPYTTFANPTSELQSYFGRVNLNFFNRYLLTGTLRADGSSKFGENHRYGYFPSAGFKWQVGNENFMKDNRVFSNLGLRFSYGLTGNQEFPAGSSQEQFRLTSYNNAPQVVNGNPNLKWETTKQFDIGLDFVIGINGRLFGSVDYYHKNTSDILFQTVAIQPAPSSLSFINLPNAHLINSGFEVALNARLISNDNVDWNVTWNFAYNKNIIRDFTDPNTGLDLMIKTGILNGQGVSGTLAQVITNNKPVDEFYLKKFKGFDKDGNQLLEADPSFAGDPNPHSLLGFGTTLRFKKLTFGVRFGGAFGHLIYNNTRTSITNMAGLAQGRNIDLLAYESDEQPNSGVSASTRFLESGNYLKFRNATISYNVGDLGKYFRDVKMYLSADNIFIFTGYSGFDPEVNVDKTVSAYPSRSIDFVPYPTARRISLGLNLSIL